MALPGADALRTAALTALAAAFGALAMVLAYRTQPLVPFAAVIGIAVVVLALARPMTVLFLALGAIPLELFAVSAGGAGVTATEGLLALAALGWAAGRIVQGQSPYVPTPLNRPILLLLLSVMAGLLVAVEPFPVVRILITWTLCALVFQMIVADGRPETVRRILMTIAASAAVVAAVTAVSSGGQLQELSSLGDVARGRAAGAFHDPNILGTFLAMAIPGSLAVGLAGPLAIRPFALGAFGLMLLGLALSLSRGGLLAGAGALLVLLSWKPFRRVALGAAVLTALLTLAHANPLTNLQQVQTVTTRVLSVQYAGQSQFDQRLAIYKETPRIIEDHLLFGVGANQFSVVAPRYGLVDPYTGYTFDHAHNIALTIGAELGVFGLIALAWLVVVLVRVLWTATVRARVHRALGVAVAASLSALALQGLIDYTLRSNVIAALAAIFAACAVVIARSASEDPFLAQDRARAR